MSQPQIGSGRGHARNKSSVTRSTRPRSSTKGPLDVEDDPLSPPASSSNQLSPNPLPIRRSVSSTRTRQVNDSPISQIGETGPKDFSFLLRPEIYHPLTPLNVPQAFRNSSKQPSSNASPEDLLAKGHFRAAAIAAVQELTGSGGGGGNNSNAGVDPHNAKRIFDLLYLRLACLTLIDATSLAAQEVKALEDLTSVRTYVDEASGEHIVPWELRVLNVRLQALGFSDPRRAVMSYHELAREARDHASKAIASHNHSSAELWKARLQDLGIKVAGALVDMNDLSGAAHHLSTLHSNGDGRLEMSKALMYLQLGDSDSAKSCARRCASDAATTEKIILALCEMAEAHYGEALARWQELQDSIDDEMVAVNSAVCLLYLGRMREGRDTLEKLISAGLSSHALLFNLSTMYELCTERNRSLKLGLVERVARMDESPAGWEKTNADFKL